MDSDLVSAEEMILGRVARQELRQSFILLKFGVWSSDCWFK